MRNGNPLTINFQKFIPMIIAVIAFTFHIIILNRNPLIYGIDGPYYLIQIEHLINYGKLKYGDPPLSFLIFTLVTLILGGNSILATKISVALFSALSSISIYFLMKKLTSNEASGLIASISFTFNPLYIRLISDFLKNAIGIFFTLTFIHYLNKLIEKELKSKELLLTIILLSLTYMTHILDFGFALLYLLTFSLLSIVLNISRRNTIKITLILIIILIIIISITFLTFPKLFTDIYKGESFLIDLISSPIELRLTQILFDFRSGIPILPFLIAGLIISISELFENRSVNNLSLLSIIIVGLILCLPIIPLKWLWRFTLMEFIPISIILGYCISKVENRATLIALILIILSPIILQSINMGMKVGPVITINEYRELEEIAKIIPKNSAIQVRSPALYWVEYITNCDLIKGRINYELWRKYNHIFILIHKRHPSKLPFKVRIVFDGKYFILAKLIRRI